MSLQPRLVNQFHQTRVPEVVTALLTANALNPSSSTSHNPSRSSNKHSTTKTSPKTEPTVYKRSNNRANRAKPKTVNYASRELMLHPRSNKMPDYRRTHAAESVASAHALEFYNHQKLEIITTIRKLEKSSKVLQKSIQTLTAQIKESKKKIDSQTIAKQGLEQQLTTKQSEYDAMNVENQRVLPAFEKEMAKVKEEADRQKMAHIEIIETGRKDIDNFRRTVIAILSRPDKQFHQYNELLESLMSKFKSQTIRNIYPVFSKFESFLSNVLSYVVNNNDNALHKFIVRESPKAFHWLNPDKFNFKELFLDFITNLNDEFERYHKEMMQKFTSEVLTKIQNNIIQQFNIKDIRPVYAEITRIENELSKFPKEVIDGENKKIVEKQRLLDQTSALLLLEESKIEQFTYKLEILNNLIPRLQQKQKMSDLIRQSQKRQPQYLEVEDEYSIFLKHKEQLLKDLSRININIELEKIKQTTDLKILKKMALMWHPDKASENLYEVKIHEEITSAILERMEKIREEQETQQQPDMSTKNQILYVTDFLENFVETKTYVEKFQLESIKGEIRKASAPELIYMETKINDLTESGLLSGPNVSVVESIMLPLIEQRKKQLGMKEGTKGIKLKLKRKNNSKRKSNKKK
jgi:hypothetical protein